MMQRFRSMAWQRSITCSMLLAAALAFSVGCGPKIPPCYPVAGKVSWKGGKAFTEGNITFQHKTEQDIVAVGTIGADGTFTVSTKMFGMEKPGAPEGEYTVMVEDPKLNLAPDGQEQIKPMVVTQQSFKVEAKDGNSFTVEVVK